MYTHTPTHAHMHIHICLHLHAYVTVMHIYTYTVSWHNYYTVACETFLQAKYNLKLQNTAEVLLNQILSTNFNVLCTHAHTLTHAHAHTIHTRTRTL